MKNIPDIDSLIPATYNSLWWFCRGCSPLPIPNREVKPLMADGTAQQCGRVGSCHIYLNLLMVIKKIFSFKEYNFEIELIHTKISAKYLLLIVANSTRMGGGFMISPEGSITDGRLDLITCDPLSVFKRLKYLPVIEKGKHLTKSFINHERITSVKINCEKQMCVQIDGELILGNRFEIEILPGKYLFKY